MVLEPTWPGDQIVAGCRVSGATDHMGRDLHLQNQAPTAAGSVRGKYFGGGPLGRVCIDTLSSVSFSLWTFDIDAPPINALWLGDEGGQDAYAQPGRRLAPRWWRRVRPAARRCLKYEPAIPAGHDSVITSSVRCPVLVHGNAYPTMELRQSSQTTPDCCPMVRVTQFGVNADLVPRRVR